MKTKVTSKKVKVNPIPKKTSGKSKTPAKTDNSVPPADVVTTTLNKTDELEKEALKVIRAVIISENNDETGHVMEFVTNLLFKHERYCEDIPWQFACICTEMLSLLADPSISQRLPEYIRPVIGKRLLDLHNFFDSIDDKSCTDAYNLYEVQSNSPNEERLKELISDYTKRLIEKKRKELDRLESKFRLDTHFGK